VRIDPVIPFVNDQPGELVEALASIGVRHVTFSTYKVKPDNWRRLSEALPKAAEKLKPLYFQQGEKIGGNTLLPKEVRFKILRGVRDLAAVHGMKFGVCREGLAELNTAPCDGSWLLPKREA
jgi:DNA repair photolyase